MNGRIQLLCFLVWLIFPFDSGPLLAEEFVFMTYNINTATGGLSEIATILDLTEEATKKRQVRALERLQQHLNDDTEGRQER